MNYAARYAVQATNLECIRSQFIGAINIACHICHHQRHWNGIVHNRKTIVYCLIIGFWNSATKANRITYFCVIIIVLPETMSTHLLSFRSGSDAIDTGRLLLMAVDFFHPSSFFNSVHIMSLSESGVSRATSKKRVDHTVVHTRLIVFFDHFRFKRLTKYFFQSIKFNRSI